MSVHPDAVNFSKERTLLELRGGNRKRLEPEEVCVSLLRGEKCPQTILKWQPIFLLVPQSASHLPY